MKDLYSKGFKENQKLGLNQNVGSGLSRWREQSIALPACVHSSGTVIENTTKLIGRKYKIRVLKLMNALPTGPVLLS